MSQMIKAEQNIKTVFKVNAFIKLFLLILLMTFKGHSQEFNMERTWGTYFGDERFLLQDSKADKSGNLYVVGYFVPGSSLILPTFDNYDGFQQNYGGGDSDGFIAKFNQLGALVWYSYFGGTGEDIISGIDIDNENNVYILGLTNSTENIVTPGAYQTIINGQTDMFISKFSGGGDIIWSSYYGGSGYEGQISNLYSLSKMFFISHDGNNHFYIAGECASVNLGTTGTFQPVRGDSNHILAKFDSGGDRIWASYYGRSGNISGISATETTVYIRGRFVDCGHQPPFDSYYGTVDSYQPEPLSCSGTYLSRFNVNGQRIWSTYYADYDSTTSNSVKAYGDKVYFSGTGSSDLIASPGSFQTTAGEEIPPYLVQFSEDGTRDWGTFNGSNIGYPASGQSSSNSVTVDDSGGVYISGEINLHTNVATEGAYQTQLSSFRNGYVCKFDYQGKKIWGTYYGGNGREFEMHSSPSNDNFYLVGRTTSTSGMTTENCYQSDLKISELNGFPINIFISFFEPIPLTTKEFVKMPFAIIPNPNNGNFIVCLENALQKNCIINLYDLLCKKILTQEIITGKTEIHSESLARGIYLAKITADDDSSYSVKFVIE